MARKLTRKQAIDLAFAWHSGQTKRGYSPLYKFASSGGTISRLDMTEIMDLTAEIRAAKAYAQKRGDTADARKLDRLIDYVMNQEFMTIPRSNPAKFDGQKVNLPAGTVAGDFPGLAERLRTIIQPGDIVEYYDHRNQRRRGRVVFRLPGHLTLNMGGKHGTPAVVYYEMVAKHIRSKRRHGG